MELSWLPLFLMAAVCVAVAFGKKSLAVRLGAGAIGFFLLVGALAEFFSPSNWLGMLVLGFGLASYGALRYRRRRRRKLYGRHAYPLTRP